MTRPALVLALAVAACGCHVRNFGYNPVPGSIVAVTPAQIPIDRVDPGCAPKGHPCLAFIEFDEMGESWDPPQIDEATRLIDRASADAVPPIVFVFVHGWKNNARQEPKNGNILGFEGVLDYLATDRYKGVPIVGIYIGWRGDVISRHWPIARQFSYFNRERAAIRIPGASMTAALTRIMVKTRQSAPNAKIIMLGHSFGGLMLERALTQGMTDFVVRGGDGARADLMVFVNSAAAASEGKQMMDLLQGKEYGPGAEVRPLFLSISSLGDAATRSAMPIGHGPSSLGYTLNGSWRTYKTPDQWGVTSQRDYYMSTTAHMPQLQSHLVVDLDDQARCGRIVRGPVGLPNGRQYVVCEKPGRLNTTPYWAMQMPAAIVRDHSGIFNANFIDLLMMFFPPAEELRTPVEQREPLLRPAR